MKFELKSSSFFTLIWYGSLVYFIYLLLLITLQYIPINYDVAFLRLKFEEVRFTHYRIAFFSHVFSSIVVIVAGLPQFSSLLRKKILGLHRFLGKIYIALILLIASPSGLVLAYYANGGIISQISFAILSILWFIFTLSAFRYIKKGEIEQHRNFMIRSYALTLSAISLRLFKFGIVSVFELGPMDTYRIVAILAWTVNLLIAEIYIRRKRLLPHGGLRT